MDIKTLIHVRRLLLACSIVLILVSTGCKQQATPRPPLSADEVKTIAAEFERVSSAHVDAWNKHDRNLFIILYRYNITYHEDGIAPMGTGERVFWLTSYVLEHWPDHALRSVDTFIGREDGFDVMEIWNWQGATKENPFTGYYWYTLRNGQISDLWLFWGPGAFTRIFIPEMNATFTDKPLQDYASAWSSGDLETVADLYATDVVRQDTLYGENQQGSSAVNEFAAEFFAWYPGVRLELLQPFKLDETGMTGGVYAIHVIDQAGKPCDVRAVILLELAEDKITKEWMFYNADSLIACGWAQ